MQSLSSSKIILIGASAGGPGVIEKLIASLPDNFSIPICIVQHFPSELTNSFASKLQMRTSNKVIESYDGMILDKGTIVIAKGGMHLGFRCISDHFAIEQTQTGIRNDFIPSVDMMMVSSTKVYEPSSILAILLSGIGDDGVEGMVKIHELGGFTICQDEKSSAVFGMPARAIERGAAKAILSIEEIATTIVKFAS